MSRSSLYALFALAMLATRPLVAQDAEDDPRLSTVAKNMSGPRFGLTFVSGALADTLRDRFSVHSPITQFGWQFETQIFKVDDGMKGLTEVIVLAGGLDQGILLPTLTWLVGIRTGGGMEFGVGPNASPAGIALAAAGGITLRHEGVSFPLNLAYVSGKGGGRVSILTGFNIRR